jgi:hypothetical protein
MVHLNGASLLHTRLDPSQLPLPTIAVFTVDDNAIEYGAHTTLRWGATGTSRVLISPGSAEPELVAGVRNISPLEDTTYTLTAMGLSGSVTASTTLTILPRAPTIELWIARPDEIVAGTESELSWTTQFATSVWVTPSDGSVYDEQRHTIVVTPTESTTYTLHAANPHGEVTQDVMVDVSRLFILDSFTAPTSEIGTEDTLTLSWHVTGSADVELVGFGLQPLVGTLDVVPGESRDYELRVSNGGVVESAFVSVTVTPLYERSRFFLSFDRNSVVTEPSELEVYRPFEVHVLGLSLDGQGIFAVEFGLDVPPGLTISDVDMHTGVWLNIVSPPDFIVGYGQCFPLKEVQLLATLTVVAMNDATLEEGAIRLRPASRPSIPGQVAYATCEEIVEGSEIDGPTHSAVQGPPLSLRGTRVANAQMGLRAERVGDSVTLSWSTLPVEAGYVALGRSVDGGPVRGVIELDTRTRSWVDTTAPSSAELRYELSAFEGTQMLVQESVVLSGKASIPSRSALRRNTPNPFNPSTLLRFSAAEIGSYELQIINTAGRNIRTLRDEVSVPGLREILWDGHDELGGAAASGVYFVRLIAPDARDDMRIVLPK